MVNSKNYISTVTTALVLLTVLNSLPAMAALPEHRDDQKLTQVAPRLIVGITVDQLRSDYLQALQSKFTHGGFRRLMEEGILFENVTFDLDNPDVTSVIATLATGSYPYQNGISSRFIFDLQTLQRHSVFQDRDYIGFATDGFWSPKALLGSTLGDELKSATQMRGKVYSIAPEPEQALIAAGHAADGAFWIDDKTGHWASTTFYHDFPNYVSQQNNSKAPLFIDMASASWTSQLISTGADGIAPLLQASPGFIHKFVNGKQVNYQWFKTSPLVNDAILKMAKQFITNSRLGLAGTTDMLQLTFYAGTYQHEKTSVYASELQDAYLRLDETMESLLQCIDKAVGLQNAVVYLMGTGQTDETADDVPTLPAGEFNANRCTALLNSHLISLHGQGQWIEGFNEGQIYLNHKLIEQYQLRVDEVAREAAELVSLFSGVEEVYTTQQLLHQDYSQRIVRVRNGYDKRSGGDLVVILEPGWRLRLDDRSQPRQQTRFDIYPGPAVIFAPGRINAQHILVPVEATVIAPTVAKCIRIRAPSACRELPLF